MAETGFAVSPSVRAQLSHRRAPAGSLAKHPCGRAGLDRIEGTVVRAQEPEEIASIVLSAASDAACGLTGAVIVADVG